MNTVCRSMLAGTALAMVLGGCQKNDAPAITSNGPPPQRVTNATPIPPMPEADFPVPDAATVFAAQDAAEKAKAMHDTAALQQKPALQEEMTKVEESKAMPLPGQANDHSTTTVDKKKGG